MNDKTTTVENLKLKIKQFCEDRNWETNAVDSKNLSVALAVEAAELMEIFMWAKTNDVEKLLEKPEQHMHIQEEIADVFWYLVRICQCCDIDLTEAVFDKAVKNANKYPALK